ncbi:MAG: mechanosensitive ion channel [Chloroflexi bacterium]|nr:mechanosensitive ion channel [Chloroflexota bacterium]
MEQIQEFFSGPVGALIINVAAALLILIIGYIVARIIASVVRRLLGRTNLDNRLSNTLSEPDDPTKVPVEDTVGKIVFWLIMLFVITAALERLNLSAISQPLQAFLDQITTLYIPRLFGAAVLLVIAWLVATAFRYLMRKVGHLLKIDERLSKYGALEEGERVNITESLATAVYWLIFLLFIPSVLQALGLTAIAEPFAGVFAAIFAYIPNVLAAAVIAVTGWFIARILREIVTNLLRAAGADAIGKRAGMPEDRSLSETLGTVLYVVVIVLVIIATLEQLNIPAISEPLAAMLNQVVAFVPGLLGAIVVLLLAYYVGKIVAGLVRDLLGSVGFDALPGKLGLKWSASNSPSYWVGSLTLLVIMLFAATWAVELLGSDFLVSALGQFINFLWLAFLAAVIFAFGLYFANLGYNIVRDTGMNNSLFLARVVRVVIIFFATAMALRELGVADDIVNLAFGLILGALALAFALAFGLGGRDIAARETDGLLSKMRAPADDGDESAEA